jgi:hypothetical protein
MPTLKRKKGHAPNLVMLDWREGKSAADVFH